MVVPALYSVANPLRHERQFSFKRSLSQCLPCKDFLLLDFLRWQCLLNFDNFSNILFNKNWMCVYILHISYDLVFCYLPFDI